MFAGWGSQPGGGRRQWEERLGGEGSPAEGPHSRRAWWAAAARGHCEEHVFKSAAKEQGSCCVSFRSCPWQGAEPSGPRSRTLPSSP